MNQGQKDRLFTLAMAAIMSLLIMLCQFVSCAQSTQRQIDVSCSPCEGIAGYICIAPQQIFLKVDTCRLDLRIDSMHKYKHKQIYMVADSTQNYRYTGTVIVFEWYAAVELNFMGYHKFQKNYSFK